MLVTDETEGCISRKLPQSRLTQPHSSSLIDLDGDCISDLFLTVTDGKTSYYEIYLRRERISQENATGYNSYCLVAREEIPSNSLVQFTDVDRDGMIDLVYSTESTLNIHYNKL